MTRSDVYLILSGIWIAPGAPLIAQTFMGLGATALCFYYLWRE